MSIEPRNFKENLFSFENIIPEGRKGGSYCYHSNDPHIPSWIPRGVSTDRDIWICYSSVDSPNNGQLFYRSLCQSDNGLVAMVKTFGQRIHFMHLESTARMNKVIFMSRSFAGDVDSFVW